MLQRITTKRRGCRAVGQEYGGVQEKGPRSSPGYRGRVEGDEHIGFAGVIMVTQIVHNWGVGAFIVSDGLFLQHCHGSGEGSIWTNGHYYHCVHRVMSRYLNTIPDIPQFIADFV